MNYVVSLVCFLPIKMPDGNELLDNKGKQKNFITTKNINNRKLIIACLLIQSIELKLMIKTTSLEKIINQRR